MISTPILRCLQRLDDLLDPGGLGDAERRRRLVEQDQLLRPVGGARDGDALALAAGEVADDGVRRGDAHVELLHQLLGLGDHRSAVEQAEAVPSARGRGTCSCRPSAGRRAPGPGRPPRCRARAPSWRSPSSPVSPSMVMAPEVGGCTPEMILISVDLPAPLSPTSATISPGWTSSEKLSMAMTPPKVLRMSLSLQDGRGCVHASSS